MPENNGSGERLEQIEKSLAEASQMIVQIVNLQAEQSRFLLESTRAWDERHGRTERHLDVLIELVEDQIRDPSIKSLKERVLELEKRWPPDAPTDTGAG